MVPQWIAQGQPIEIECGRYLQSLPCNMSDWGGLKHTIAKRLVVLMTSCKIAIWQSSIIFHLPFRLSSLRGLLARKIEAIHSVMTWCWVEFATLIGTLPTNSYETALRQICTAVRCRWRPRSDPCSPSSGPIPMCNSYLLSSFTNGQFCTWNDSGDRLVGLSCLDGRVTCSSVSRSHFRMIFFSHRTFVVVFDMPISFVDS